MSKGSLRDSQTYLSNLTSQASINSITLAFLSPVLSQKSPLSSEQSKAFLAKRFKYFHNPGPQTQSHPSEQHSATNFCSQFAFLLLWQTTQIKSKLEKKGFPLTYRLQSIPREVVSRDSRQEWKQKPWRYRYHLLAVLSTFMHSTGATTWRWYHPQWAGPPPSINN